MERPRTEHTRYALLPRPAPAGARRHRLLPRARGWPGCLARAHPAAHRPVTARPRARACPLSRTTAGRRHTRPGCPLLRLPNLPPAHLPLALPRASDWVPVCRRWARPAARLRNALGWVGRARIFVWSVLLVPLGCLPRQQRFSCLFQPFLCRLQPFQRRPAGLGDGLGRPGVADLEWVGLGGSGRCCLGREASAISVDRWGKPQNWPRQSPGTRRGIAPLPARRMARFDRLTRFF